MRDLARRPEEDRRDLFRAAAQAMRVHEAVIEKDFWVCWILDYLFQDSPWKTHMAFKGGTSLSKAFHAIERFSEDIDLVLDWRLLGYSMDEPWDARSATKQTAFGEDALQRATAFLAENLTPVLRRDLSVRAGADMAVVAAEEEVRVRYPRAFPLPTIHPEIRLEIGPLAAWMPNEEKEIRPYAAEQFPQHFKHPFTTVRTILAERTFWEKATILHREAHRTADKPLPPHATRPNSARIIETCRVCSLARCRPSMRSSAEWPRWRRPSTSCAKCNSTTRRTPQLPCLSIIKWSEAAAP